jgi:hypothetical protein
MTTVVGLLSWIASHNKTTHREVSLLLSRVQLTAEIGLGEI